MTEFYNVTFVLMNEVVVTTIEAEDGKRLMAEGAEETIAERAAEFLLEDGIDVSGAQDIQVEEA